MNFSLFGFLLNERYEKDGLIRIFYHTQNLIYFCQPIYFEKVLYCRKYRELMQIFDSFWNEIVILKAKMIRDEYLEQIQKKILRLA